MATHPQRQHAGPTALNRENVNKKTKSNVEAGVAVDRRATGAETDATPREHANTSEPRARRSRATDETRATHEKGAAGRTQSQALKDYWRDVKSGKRARNDQPVETPKDPNRNPLLDLPDADRAKLFVMLRLCPYLETANLAMRERGLPEVDQVQLDEFHKEEADHYWEVNTARAITEADALVRMGEKAVPKLSAGMLTALAQEAFKQITNGVDPALMTRMATLFFKARGDNRADEMQGFKRRKAEHDLGDEMHAAFRRLAEEVDRCPAAQEHFDALQRALAENAEEAE